MSEFKTGDPVVYRKTKYSSHPGPRARNVSPSRHGDAYAYCVDKLWLVVKLKSPDRVEVITRRGKRRELSVEDPNLRPATWLDRPAATIATLSALIGPRVVCTPVTRPPSVSMPVTSQFWMRSTPRWSAPRA